MTSLNSLTHAGQVVAIVVETLVLGKSIYISRRDPLRSFAVLLGVLVTSELVALVTPYHTPLYYYVFVVEEALRIGLSSWVVLTIYQTIFQRYPGIRTLSGWAIKVGFVAAVLVGIFTGAGAGGASKDIELQQLFRAEILVSSTFVAFLILIQVFLLYFPIRLNRNTIVHTFAFGLLFLCSTLVFLDLGKDTGRAAFVRFLFQYATIGAYSIWLFGLTKAGELDTRVTGSGWNSDRERDLQRQLDSLERLIVATSKGSPPEDDQPLERRSIAPKRNVNE